MRPSPLLALLSVLTIVALGLALAVGRPELVLVAVPLVVALLSARRLGVASGIAVTVVPSATTLVEDDCVDLVLTVASPDTAAPSIEIFLALPDSFVFVDGARHLATSLNAGDTVERRLIVRSTARGRGVVGPITVRLTDHSGLWVDEAMIASPVVIETYPRVPEIRHLPRPSRTRSSFGNVVSARLGTGLEPGDIRAFVPGDRVRHINWPVSLRLGKLHVTQFHREQNADIVLLLDTLAETGAHPQSSVDACVRAVTALATGYLAQKDRVGLVEFGGYLRWLKPATGQRQLTRLLQAAVSADQVFTHAVRDLDYVPATALPRQALVIAISPLIDERFANAVVELSGRGYDVVLLAVSAVELTRRVLPDTPLDDVACALWQLELGNRLQHLRHSGIAVAEWRPEEPLDIALASLSRRVPARAAIR